MPSEGEAPAGGKASPEGEAAGRGVPRLVVDTNLFVGNLFRPQAHGPAEIVDRWRRGTLRLCVSADVLGEMRGTLGRLPVSDRRRAEILDRLEDPAFTDLVEEVTDSGFRCADPNDDKFLHLTIAAGADALVTSDRALLAVEGFPVPVLKSGQWLRTAGR